MKPRFDVDLRDAARSSSGNVHARCCLRLDGEIAFPQLEWSDFVVVVLRWWTEAFLELFARRSADVEIRFMEGPYLVRVSRSSPERVRLECVEAGLRSRVVHVRSADVSELVDSLLRAARETLDLCAGRGWDSADVEALRTSVAALHEAVRLRP